MAIRANGCSYIALSVISVLTWGILRSAPRLQVGGVVTHLRGRVDVFIMLLLADEQTSLLYTATGYSSRDDYDCYDVLLATSGTVAGIVGVV